MYSPEMSQILNDLSKSFSELIALCNAEEFIPSQIPFQANGKEYVIVIEHHRLPYQTTFRKTISIVPSEAE